MEKGTIVLTRFPFTDLTGDKWRPAVIISNVDPANPDVIVAFISSVIPVKPSLSDFILLNTHPDFVLSGLKKSSVFKMDKLATLDKSIFSGEIGSVSPYFFEQLKDKLHTALDL